MKSFHVLVEWPGWAQPWLILIKAQDENEARRIVELSDDVREHNGKVVSVEAASGRAAR